MAEQVSDRMKQIAKELAAKTVQNAPPPAPGAAPPAPGHGAPPAAPAAADGNPQVHAVPDSLSRGPDGKFQKDPNLVAQREVIKALKQKQDALEAELRELRTAKSGGDPAIAERENRRNALLGTMGKETREWWERAGADLVRLEAETVAERTLKPHERAIKRMEEQSRRDDVEAAWNADFNEFVSDMLVDQGVVVDQRAMLTTLDEFESRGFVLGGDNRTHFRNVFQILKGSTPGAAAPVKTGEEAAAVAAKEAADRAAAAGVRPAGQPTPRPQADREQELNRLREAGYRGNDEVSVRHWGARLRGLGVLPTERLGQGAADGG